ncbi:MAG: PQQ-binding-like beta-propeller repeat protein [Deltaproteobacteria bacterium]|nr:PQQ-binding-like beta-propeller repeat protein [Deltaproteobacteria bacterium]
MILWKGLDNRHKGNSQGIKAVYPKNAVTFFGKRNLWSNTASNLSVQILTYLKQYAPFCSAIFSLSLAQILRLPRNIKIKCIFRVYIPIIFFIISTLPACSSLNFSFNFKKQVAIEKTPAPPPVEIKTDSWDTYLKDTSRSGLTEDTIKPPLRSYWTFDLKNIWNILPMYPTQNSSPAVVDNVAFIGSTDKIFYALNLNDKKALWQFKTSGAIESSPAYFMGKIYFGTNDGILYCLDAKNGKEVWHFNIKAEIISSPLIINNIIYFSSVDDKVYALDASTGAKIWHYNRTFVKRITQRQYASPSYYKNRVYMVFSDGFLVNMDAPSGREIWKKKIYEEDIYVRSTPVIDSGKIYLINGEGVLIVLDAETGDERWRFDITKSIDFAIKKNTIFLLNQGGQIFAVNKITGESLWREKVTKGNPASAIIAGNHLIVASNYSKTFLDVEFLTVYEGYIDIFNIDNGEIVWTENINSTISTTPIAAYNKLLFANNKGKLYIYSSQ